MLTIFLYKESNSIFNSFVTYFSTQALLYAMKKNCKYCLPIHPKFEDDSCIPSLLLLPKNQTHKVLNLMILEAVSKGYLDVQSRG